MPWLISCALLLTVAGTLAGRFRAHLRTLDAHGQPPDADVDLDRYRPMLRLLSREDVELMTDPVLRRQLRARHCALLREYIHSLARDYGNLLASLRLIISQSAVDRPDLAKALVRYRLSFAVAFFRLDFHMRLYAWGIGTPEALRRDLSGLVDALGTMRGQFRLVAESAVWGQ